MPTRARSSPTTRLPTRRPCQVRVNPELIKRVPARTLVLWGEEDDVLPVEDAYKFEADLPNCARVTLIPDAQHAPALENPPFVATTISDYVREFAASTKVAA